MNRLMFITALLTLAEGDRLGKLEPYIPGGSETTIEKHPYQVAIHELAFNRYHCGGVIISPKHVLSSANCLRYPRIPNRFDLRVGSTSHKEGGEIYRILKIVLNPHYVNSDLKHDIAIATLMEPIAFNAATQPINLVPEHQELNPGEMLTITGWGSVRGINRPADKLRELSVPAVDRHECQDKYGSSVVLTDDMVCAGAKDPGIAEGDIGGPLVNSQKQLVGVALIANYGKPHGTPAIYINIASSAIRTFITNNMK